MSDKKCAGCGSLIAITSNYITVNSNGVKYYEPHCFEIKKFSTMESIEELLIRQNNAMLHIVKSIPTLNENTKLLSDLLVKVDNLVTVLTTIATAPPPLSYESTKPKVGRPKKAPVAEKN
jgi:hypothetical protein